MTTPSLKRPAQKMLNAFRVSMVGQDTIRTLLEKRFSLVVCCKHCPRMIEWTPSELASRFGDRVDLRLADLVPRLTCTGEDGCGTREIAVFPYFWPGDWRWRPASEAPPENEGSFDHEGAPNDTCGEVCDRR